MNFIKQHIWLVSLHVFSLVSFLLISLSLLLPNRAVIDIWAYTFFRTQSNEILTQFLLSISNLFHPVYLIIVTGIFFVVLYLNGRRVLASILLLAMTGGSILVLILKYLFDVVRPLGVGAYEIGPAFPSSHATASAILAVMLIVLVGKKVKDKTLHTLFSFVMFGCALLTGLSRIYITVHWVTDVAGGFALGVAIATFALLVYARIHHHQHGVYLNHF